MQLIRIHYTVVILTPDFEVFTIHSSSPDSLSTITTVQTWCETRHNEASVVEWLS